MALPLVFFYLISKIIRSFFAAYQYQQARQSRGTGHSSGRSGNNNQRQQSYNTSSGYGDPYDVLKCSRKSSNEEVKKSYRLLISKYHPDKFVGMDLDDEFVKLASKKFQEIQAAYDQVRKQRGF